MKKASLGSWIIFCALMALPLGCPANTNAASSMITANASCAVLANSADTAGSTEDFETGGFTEFPWDHAGDTHWTATASEWHSGNHCAKAGTIEDNETRFDARASDHGHFKCESCGCIFDFEIDIDSFLIDSLEQFKINEKNVYFNGICPKCIEKY